MRNRTRKGPAVMPLALLLLASLFVAVLTSVPILQPGTMDSHYYYGAGQSLLQSHAFVEPIIWNYLDPPAGLPAPSHLYWMPLPSILVALAQAILGPTFKASQIPFILLTAALPLVSFLTSWHLSHNQRHALIAGVLTIFSGFFLPYWTIPETFAPFAVAGGLALYCLARWGENRDGWWLLAAGLLAGLGHLGRADGILLLLAGLIFVVVQQTGKRVSLPATKTTPTIIARAVALLTLGYLVVMTPWFMRNWLVIGSPLSAAGARTVFMRSYDELFSYGTPLTWEHLSAWGWGNILRSKLGAAWSNLQTFVAVDNLIFLTPLTLIGLWQMRKRPFLWPAALYAALLFGVMTLFFTFPGARGGVFHSSAALLPAIMAVAMVGLDTAVDWVALRRRRWDRQSARRFFSYGAAVLAAGLSLFVYQRRVIGDGSWANPAWNQADAVMVAVGEWLMANEPDRPVVMVGNPPAFHFHTGLPAIVVPNEGLERTLAAAHRYGAKFLVLDENQPAPLTPLYQGHETSPALNLVWQKSSVRLYQLVAGDP